MGRREQLEHVTDLAARRGYLPEGGREVGVRYLERFVAVFKANVQAVAGYRPSSYPGRVTLVRAARPPHREAASPPSDPRNGWGQLAVEVEVHEVAAAHQNMMKEPYVGEVADVVRQRLEGLHGGAR